MCTAATFLSDDFYFGRNLDYEFSYGDEVAVTPRGYAFSLRRGDTFRTRYAIIGMAYVQGDYPLYYDAINEKGLGVAGLNFVGNAVYHSAQADRDNIAQFELIPWLLGQCATLNEARTLIERMNLLNEPFSPQLPLASCTGSSRTEPVRSPSNPPPTGCTFTITLPACWPTIRLSPCSSSR